MVVAVVAAVAVLGSRFLLLERGERRELQGGGGGEEGEEEEEEKEEGRGKGRGLGERGEARRDIRGEERRRSSLD